MQNRFEQSGSINRTEGERLKAELFEKYKPTSKSFQDVLMDERGTEGAHAFLLVGSMLGLFIADMRSGEHLAWAVDKALSFVGAGNLAKDFTYFSAISAAVFVTCQAVRGGIEQLNEKKAVEEGIHDFLWAEYKIQE